MTVHNILKEYGIRGTPVFFHNSENSIYIVKENNVPRYVLRLCRKGYHSREEVLGEIKWLELIEKETDIKVPHILETKEGKKLCATDDTYAVLWQYIEGRSLSETQNYGKEQLMCYFYDMGVIAAKLHNLSAKGEKIYRLPRTLNHMAGKDPLWGDWRDFFAKDKKSLDILEAAYEKACLTINSVRVNNENYGLIHSDIRLSNLIDRGKSLALLDFDDCCYGYFALDLAGSLSFMETHPLKNKLTEQWLKGYETLRTSDCIFAVDEFVFLRRLQLLGWLNTHCNKYTKGFLKNMNDTVGLAEKLLL